MNQTESRLRQLWPLSQDLFDFVSTEAVIAGGTIVYALNDFVPIDSVGDIDIFVDSLDKAVRLMHLINDAEKILKFELMMQYDNSFNEQSIDNASSAPKKCSVVTCHFERPGLKDLQFVMQSFDHPLQIIENFDMDYVQCAYHKGQFFVTDFAREAHSQRRIIRLRQNPPRYERLIKAAKKGFITCVFGVENRECAETIEQQHPPTLDQLQMITERRNLIDPYLIDDVKFDSYSIKSIGFNEIIQQVDHWCFKNTKLGSVTKIFSIEINVIDVVEKDNYKLIKIDPVVFLFGDTKIVAKSIKCFNMNDNLFVVDQKCTVVVLLYRVVFEFSTFFRFMFIDGPFDSNYTKATKIGSIFDQESITEAIDDYEENHGYRFKSIGKDDPKTRIIYQINQKIRQLTQQMEKVGSKGEADFIHIRTSAYRCFLYKFNDESKSFNEAAKEAARQMTCDAAKISGRSLMFWDFVDIDMNHSDNVNQLFYQIETRIPSNFNLIVQKTIQLAENCTTCEYVFKSINQ